MDTMDTTAKKFLVVGGGTAGWLTALYLTKTFPQHKVTLMESKPIGILGAGEGSTPHLTSFLRMLGVDINELIKETKGTIKQGISFENWNGDGEKYFHPFAVHNEYNEFSIDNLFGYGCYDYYWAWQDQAPSSNTFRVGAVDYVNASNKNYFAWITAQVSGFSSFGTYTGNGDATTGPTITTGFQPSFVICGTAKEGRNTHPFICTNRHQSSNTGLNVTMADWHGRWMSSNATMDFLSTGFRVNSQYNTYNGNGDSYWYMAWGDPDILG